MESRQSTTDDDTYIHLEGTGAIHFNKATNEFEVYAYDKVAKRVVRGSRLSVRSVPAENDPNQNDPVEPWIILSNMQLVVEVPTVDLTNRLVKLKTGEPHLEVTVEASELAGGDFGMTPIDPPVGTNRVPPL